VRIRVARRGGFVHPVHEPSEQKWQSGGKVGEEKEDMWEFFA
jgi:hypothetical protein